MDANNLIVQLQAWWKPILLCSYVFGTGLCIAGITGLCQVRSPMQQSGRFGAVCTIIAGIFLLNLPGLLDIMSMTFFSRNAMDIMSYTPAASGTGAAYVRLGTVIIGMTGLFAVIRAGWLFKNAGSGAQSFGPAITHLVGGTLALNFPVVMQLLGHSLGGPLKSTITSIF